MTSLTYGSTGTALRLNHSGLTANQTRSLGSLMFDNTDLVPTQVKLVKIAGDGSAEIAFLLNTDNSNTGSGLTLDKRASDGATSTRRHLYLKTGDSVAADGSYRLVIAEYVDDGTTTSSDITVLTSEGETAHFVFSMEPQFSKVQIQNASGALEGFSFSDASPEITIHETDPTADYSAVESFPGDDSGGTDRLILKGQIFGYAGAPEVSIIEPDTDSLTDITRTVISDPLEVNVVVSAVSGSEITTDTPHGFITGDSVTLTSGSDTESLTVASVSSSVVFTTTAAPSYSSGTVTPTSGRHPSTRPFHVFINSEDSASALDRTGNAVTIHVQGVASESEGRWTVTAYDDFPAAFQAGGVVALAGSDDGGNDGDYTIISVSGSSMVIEDDGVAYDDTSVSSFADTTVAVGTTSYSAGVDLNLNLDEDAEGNVRSVSSQHFLIKLVADPTFGTPLVASSTGTTSDGATAVEVDDSSSAQVLYRIPITNGTVSGASDPTLAWVTDDDFSDTTAGLLSLDLGWHEGNRVVIVSRAAGTPGQAAAITIPSGGITLTENTRTYNVTSTDLSFHLFEPFTFVSSSFVPFMTVSPAGVDGSEVLISSIEEGEGVAVFNTATDHGLTTGDQVDVEHTNGHDTGAGTWYLSSLSSTVFALNTESDLSGTYMAYNSSVHIVGDSSAEVAFTGASASVAGGLATLTLDESHFFEAGDSVTVDVDGDTSYDTTISGVDVDGLATRVTFSVDFGMADGATVSGTVTANTGSSLGVLAASAGDVAKMALRYEFQGGVSTDDSNGVVLRFASILGWNSSQGTGESPSINVITSDYADLKPVSEDTDTAASGIAVTPSPAGDTVSVIIPLEAVGSFASDIVASSGAGLATAFLTRYISARLERAGSSVIDAERTTNNLRLYAPLIGETTVFQHYFDIAEAAGSAGGSSIGNAYDVRYLVSGGVRKPTLSVSESDDNIDIETDGDGKWIVKASVAGAPSGDSFTASDLSAMGATDSLGSSINLMSGTDAGKVFWYRTPEISLPSSTMVLANASTSEASFTEMTVEGVDYSSWSVSAFEYRYGRKDIGVATATRDNLVAGAATAVTVASSTTLTGTDLDSIFEVGDRVTFRPTNSLISETSATISAVTSTLITLEGADLGVDTSVTGFVSDRTMVLMLEDNTFSDVSSDVSIDFSSLNGGSNFSKADGAVDITMAQSFSTDTLGNDLYVYFKVPRSSVSQTDIGSNSNGSRLWGAQTEQKLVFGFSGASWNLGSTSSLSVTNYAPIRGFSRITDSTDANVDHVVSSAWTNNGHSAFTVSGITSGALASVSDSKYDDYAVFTYATSGAALAVGDAVTLEFADADASAAYDIAHADILGGSISSPYAREVVWTNGSDQVVLASTYFSADAGASSGVFTGLSGTGTRFDKAIFGADGVTKLASGTTFELTGAADSDSWAMGLLPIIAPTALAGAGISASGPVVELTPTLDVATMQVTPAVGTVGTGNPHAMEFTIASVENDFAYSSSSTGADLYHPLQVDDTILMTNFDDVGAYSDNNGEWVVTDVSEDTADGTVTTTIQAQRVAGDAVTFSSLSDSAPLRVNMVVNTQLTNERMYAFSSDAFSLSLTYGATTTDAARIIDLNGSKTGTLTIDVNTGDVRYQTGQEFLLQLITSSQGTLRRNVMLRAPGTVNDFTLEKVAGDSYMDSLTLGWGTSPADQNVNFRLYVKVDSASKNWYLIAQNTSTEGVSRATVLTFLKYLPERWLSSSTPPHHPTSLTTSGRALVYMLKLANPAGDGTYNEDFELAGIEDDSDLTKSWKHAVFTTSRTSSLMNNTSTGVSRAAHEGGGGIIRTAITDDSGTDVVVKRSLLQRFSMILGTDTLYHFIPIAGETITATPAAGETLGSERYTTTVSEPVETSDGDL